MSISAGPFFKFNHSISMFVQCETETEIDTLWNKLSEKHGQIFWELKKYPFSEKYGWITDKYGLSWQLMLTKTKQNISPLLMFDGKQHGKSEEAMKFYTSIFINSKIEMLERYGQENKRCKGLVVHADFKLSHHSFMAMDSGMPADINFNEAISFIINCDDQKEIDYYWEKLSADPKAEQCGWLKDKYGVSWQIVPTIMNEMMKGDPKKVAKVTEAFLKMKKFDIKKLEQAYEAK